MIPGPKVESGKEELSAAIVNRTFETLTSLGYNVRLVDKLEEAKGPVLVLQMDQLRNYLFSWTYPLGLTWGKIGVEPPSYDTRCKRGMENQSRGKFGRRSLFFIHERL